MNYLVESAMPTEETGMEYVTKRGYTETVKQVGNRFYYYDRFMNRWMPVKKGDVKFNEIKESNDSLLSFDDYLFEAVINESFDDKPSILRSYVKSVLKTKDDIKKAELYTRKLGDGVFLVLKINGKDVYYTEFDNIEKINKSKDSFIKASTALLKEFKEKNKLDYINLDDLTFDVEKYFTAGKVNL